MPELVIVTGASSNHFRCLKNLLYTIDVFEPETRTIVYDLGLAPDERRELKKKGRELRRFPFANYPAYFDIRVESGQYAWKPVILSDVLQETGGLVLWLDAGCLLKGRLERVRSTLIENGLFSPVSAGTIARWTHPSTLRRLGVNRELLGLANRSGCMVGFNGTNAWAWQLAACWRAGALDRACIAPRGSNRSNHRQDQAVLTVLLYQFQARFGYKLEDSPLEISAYNDWLSLAAVRRQTQRAARRPIRAPKPKLRRLVLVPSSGMCNRLRAIASARRLCRQLGARCSVVWEWGNVSRLFEPMPDVRWIASLPGGIDRRMTHYPDHIGATRTADVRVETLELHSGYVFWGSHEPEIEMSALKPFLPRLASRLAKIVDRFSAEHFRNTVGLHLRRTDNRKAARYSPDCLFIACARDLIDEGKTIFLATDNLVTERMMKRRFGKAIITYPKRQQRSIRWPREFDPVAAEDDLIDLFLLSRTEYIIGSYWSSFSDLAIALNGSRKSGILKLDL